MTDKLDELKRALEFYASKLNYRKFPADVMEEPYVITDDGKIAIKALTLLTEIQSEKVDEEYLRDLNLTLKNYSGWPCETDHPEEKEAIHTIMGAARKYYELSSRGLLRGVKG